MGKIAVYVGIVSVIFVLAEAYTSFKNKTFTPAQMLTRWNKPGIPFLWHGGMWGDIFILPPLMMFIIARYANEWNMNGIIMMMSIGVAITLANHLMLIFTQDTPDPLGWKKEKLSVTIALHFIYMSVYIALIGLFYFSSSADVTVTSIVSIVIGIHTMLGTHVVLSMANRLKKWVWCIDMLNHQLMIIQLMIWSILIVLSLISSGWQAADIVAIAGAVLAIAIVGFESATRKSFHQKK